MKQIIVICLQNCKRTLPNFDNICSNILPTCGSLRLTAGSLSTQHSIQSIMLPVNAALRHGTTSLCRLIGPARKLVPSHFLIAASPAFRGGLTLIYLVLADESSVPKSETLLSRFPSSDRLLFRASKKCCLAIISLNFGKLEMAFP